MWEGGNMKKILYVLFILMPFILTGCNNTYESENDDYQETINLIKVETLETFINIDFSEFTITSVNNLLYDNGESDYEYQFLDNVDVDFMVNIIEITNQFSNEKYMIGYPLSLIPGGGHPEVVINLEYLNQSVRLLLYRGYPDSNKYSSVIIFYDNGEEEISIQYSNVFPNEFENIYNLLNES